MSFTPEQLAQLKQVIKEVLEEFDWPVPVEPPPPLDGAVPVVFTVREDGAAKTNKTDNYRASYEKSADPKKVEFAKYIPEWFFVEETLSKAANLTDAQKLNIHRNTNEARMRGGFLADYLFVGPSSTYVKGWFGRAVPDKHIPDAASLPGNNGPAAPAVDLATVPNLFNELYKRWITTGHVPGWKMVGELKDP